MLLGTHGVSDAVERDQAYLVEDVEVVECETLVHDANEKNDQLYTVRHLFAQNRCRCRRNSASLNKLVVNGLG